MQFIRADVQHVLNHIQLLLVNTYAQIKKNIISQPKNTKKYKHIKHIKHTSKRLRSRKIKKRSRRSKNKIILGP